MTDAARTPRPAISQDDNTLITNLSGGLNVTSGSLEIPVGDFPVLRNVLVNDAGNISTRPGTQKLRTISASSSVGFCAMSYQTKAGYDLVIAKNQTDIDIYQFTATEMDDVTNLSILMTKTGVWPSIAANIKFDYAVTNEPNSRIVFTTGIAAPVQLQFFETSLTLTSGSPIADFTIDSQTLAFATTANVLVWVDGSLANLNSVSYSGGTLTVTFASALSAGTHFVDFVFITWQWWAEALLLEGRDLYQPQTRFATDINDLSVSIPVDLIRTFEYIDTGAFNVIPYQASGHNDYYTFKTDFQPDLVSEFSFSQGITYDPADNKDIVPGISHVTFGVLPSAAEEVHFIKAQLLPFNGGNGIAGTDLEVVVDDNIATLNTNAATASGAWGDTYYLRNVPGTPSQFYSQSSIVTNASTTAKYISFDSTTSIGLPFASQVKLINTNDNGFAGTSATDIYDGDFIYRDGNVHPAYGMYEWADYNAGSFPRTIDLFQGRIAFGGFPNRPLQVVMSNTLDAAVPGVFFNNFAVATENQEATDPVSVFLSAVENDAAITAVISFTNSLFVFTRNKTIRLFGGDAGVTPFSITRSVIASVGAVNARCAQLVDNSVIYLGSNGLYQLAPSIQVGDFTVRPASVKITSLLKNSGNANVAWTAYNRNENEIFVAVTDDASGLVANRLFRISLFREAWSEYTLFYGRMHTSFGFIVNSAQNYLLMSVTQNTDVVDSTYQLVSYPYFYPLDLAEEDTAELSSINLDLVAVDSFTHDQEVTSLPLTFRTIPVKTFEDVKLVAAGSELVFAQDWHKTDAEFVTLTKIIGNGTTLLAYPINESGKYPFSIFLDNVRQDDFTVAVTTTTVTANLNFENPVGTVKRYGYTIPCVAITPLLVRQTITRDKQLKHLYVLLYNGNFVDVYNEADVNVAAGQSKQLVGLWRREVGLQVALRLARDSSKSRSNQLLTDLHFDIGRYDTDSPALQSSEHAKIGFALTGVSNHAQVAFYSSDSKVWEITAYELIARFAARTSLNAWD